MTKHRTLKAVGFFVVLAVALAFLALPNSQAAKGKPIKWKATVTGDNLWASGEFFGGQDQVNINYGVGTNDTNCDTDRPSGGTSGAYSYLELQVFKPVLGFLGMNSFSSWGNPDPDSNSINLAPYGFPNPSGFPNNLTIWPGCIQEFLINNLHPTADYPHITLRFTTCGCGNDINSNLMNMGVGTTLPVHLVLQFFSHNWDCPASSPFGQKTFLNLLMSAHGYVVGSDCDVKIVRTSATEWTAYVDTDFGNSLYPPPDASYISATLPGAKSDGIIGQYATCQTTGKGKNAVSTLKYYYPWAKTHLQFQIAFTKI